MPPVSRRNHAAFQRNFTRPTYDATMLYRNQAGYVRSRSPQQPRPSRVKFQAILIGLVLLAFAGHSLWSKHVSAQAASQHAKIASAEAEQKQLTFAGQVGALIDANQDDDISVAVAGTGGVQTFGQTASFDGASTAKLLTATDYLHHVEQGTASLQRNIDGQTAQHWLKTMIVDSDDTAWAELNTYLTHEDLAAYANGIGFEDYNYTDNTFTAADIAGLLQKLYDGKLLNNANKSLLLGYMKQANYRQYIVAAVPNNDAVYHKVGLDDDTVNDAAIITRGKQSMVLVIFTNGNGNYDWDSRQQLIQSITKDAVAAYL